MVIGALFLALTPNSPANVWAQGDPIQEQSAAEARTAAAFEAVRKDPTALTEFLAGMPKGGDLHNHPSGAEFAERYIDYAAKDQMCIVVGTLTIVTPQESCDPANGQIPAANALLDNVLYNQLVDAWSMRNWNPARISGHDQFFATFSRYREVFNRRSADVIADVVAQAGRDSVSYLELMFELDGGRAGKLAAQVDWDEDFGRVRDRLFAAGLPDMVTAARRDLDAIEARVRERLHCGTPDADPGCAVTVRYQQTGIRILQPKNVFTQLVIGFELVRADPRVVGVNLVGPEDAPVALRDYSLHMAMLDYLHGLAPDVPIALHAGELVPGLVPPEDLRFHVREAVERGHASRIGHGVDILLEDDSSGLLAEMAERNVAVEVPFMSNAQILDVVGDKHPFPLYRAAGVPVTLATDDAGVSRSNMTAQYQLAVDFYSLSYADLKQLVRNSLQYAFLPGGSLWSQPESAVPVVPCAADWLGSNVPSPSCFVYIQTNERAHEQWRLEAAFVDFESRY